MDVESTLNALAWDYNTRVVVLGATLLGAGAGVVGSFTLLRRRALVGDALSHATLPGIALAFLIATACGADGKSLLWLLPGAAISGAIGVAAIGLIRRASYLREDAALGIVLSVFFGLGLALLGLVQQTPEGNAAGLESFIYGKTASMLSSDAKLIAVVAGACVIGCFLLFKELTVLCFDASFAAAKGYSVLLLDAALMAMVTLITIVGLQAVGLVLMIALLVIPPAAARFWTEDLHTLAWIAASIGAVSAFVGALASAVVTDLPSGATIVLVAALQFIFSALLGKRRGALIRWRRRWQFRRKIELEHLLRAVYEIAESSAGAAASIEHLLAIRSWTPRQLRRVIRRAELSEYARCETGPSVRLTKRGELRAQWLTRQHRLWELYLITHADVAPARVDRGADDIEHVLDPETIDELERLLEAEISATPPASPHVIAPEALA